MLFTDVTLRLLQGFSITCSIFFITLVGALPLGFVIAFGSMSGLAPVRVLSRVFVWIIRGTPLMLQIIIVFYGPGLWFGMPVESRLTAVCIAFIINYGAYFSEIYRGGIESIPKGQYEAGQVLGINRRKIFTRIVLPQVVKRIMPAMGNEVITLVKDTSLARILMVGELITVSYNVVNTKAILWPLFYAGLFYLIFNGILTLILGGIEKKLSYYS